MKMKMRAVVLFFMAGLFSTLLFANSILSPVTDTVNSGIINTKIAMDHFLSNTSIDATVINGIAVFSGKVHSKAQLDELVRIAYSVTGIKGVDARKIVVEK